MIGKVLALILILLMPLLSITVTQTAQAQDNPYESIIKLWAPYNRTYTTTEPLHLDASLDIRYGKSNVYSANYTIDDGISQTIPKESMNSQFWSVTYGAVYVAADLPKLPIGQHKLTLYISVNYTNGNPPWVVSGEKTVYFTISTTKSDDAAVTGGKVNIYSPSNKTYSPTSIIPIEVSSSTIAVHDLVYSAIYSVDGQEPVKLATKSFQTYQYDLSFGSMTGTGKIYSLPEGQHNVTVLLKGYLRSTYTLALLSEASVCFAVGDPNPPNITLKALDGRVFEQTSIMLNFTVNKPASWMGYCLDNGTKTTISGNTTFTVTAGNHSIVVYANDTIGNRGQSEMAHFSVQLNEASEQQILAQIVPFGVGLVSVIAVAAVFVYFKNRRHRER